MITDSQTNFVYFSKQIKTKFLPELDRITAILDKHKIKHGLLEGTNDIWCRDFMPVQLSKTEFAGFRYEPSYLQNPIDIKTQSDPKKVCLANSIPTNFCNVNIDGGNIVRWMDRVMISDKVFVENDSTPPTQLVKQIEKHLNAEVIIIPRIKSDMTGHADGMVRFINRNTILVNELEHEYKYWQKGIEKVTSAYNLNKVELPWFEPKKKKSISAIGCYINFLEVGNLIIVPEFKIDGNCDDKAYSILKQTYKDKVIEKVEVNSIAEEGGVLNCITWNIEK